MSYSIAATVWVEQLRFIFCQAVQSCYRQVLTSVQQKEKRLIHFFTEGQWFRCTPDVPMEAQMLWLP